MPKPSNYSPTADVTLVPYERREPRQNGEIIWTHEAWNEFDKKVKKITKEPKLTINKTQRKILSTYAKSMAIQNKSLLINITIEFPEIKDRFMSWVYAEQVLENLLRWTNTTYQNELYMLSVAMEAAHYYGFKEEKKGIKRTVEGEIKVEENNDDETEEETEELSAKETFGMACCHIFLIIPDKYNDTKEKIVTKLTKGEQGDKFVPLSNEEVGTFVDVKVTVTKGGEKNIKLWSNQVCYNIGKSNCYFAKEYHNVTFKNPFVNHNVRFFFKEDPESCFEHLNCNRDELIPSDQESIFQFKYLGHKLETHLQFMTFRKGIKNEVKQGFMRYWDYIISNNFVARGDTFYKQDAHVKEHWKLYQKCDEIFTDIIHHSQNNLKKMENYSKDNRRLSKYHAKAEISWRKWFMNLIFCEHKILKIIHNTFALFPAFNTKAYHNWIGYYEDNNVVKFLNPDTAELVTELPEYDTCMQVFKENYQEKLIPKWALEILFNTRVYYRDDLDPKFEDFEITSALLGCLLRKKWPTKFRCPYFVGNTGGGKTAITHPFIYVRNPEDIGDFTTSYKFDMQGLVGAQIGYHEHFELPTNSDKFLKYTEGNEVKVNIKYEGSKLIKCDFPKIFINNEMPGNGKKRGGELLQKIRNRQPFNETPIDSRLRYVWFDKLEHEDRNLRLGGQGALIAFCIKRAKEVFGQFDFKKEEIIEEEIMEESSEENSEEK
ncbi:hypothetical protein ABK040_016157 [Willaertia magna]